MGILVQVDLRYRQITENQCIFNTMFAIVVQKSATKYKFNVSINIDQESRIDNKVIECCKQNGVPERCIGFCGRNVGATSRMTGCNEVASRIERCKFLRKASARGKGC